MNKDTCPCMQLRRVYGAQFIQECAICGDGMAELLHDIHNALAGRDRADYMQHQMQRQVKRKGAVLIGEKHR